MSTRKFRARSDAPLLSGHSVQLTSLEPHPRVDLGADRVVPPCALSARIARQAARGRGRPPRHGCRSLAGRCRGRRGCSTPQAATTVALLLIDQGRPSSRSQAAATSNLGAASASPSTSGPVGSREPSLCTTNGLWRWIGPTSRVRERHRVPLYDTGLHPTDCNRDRRSRPHGTTDGTVVPAQMRMQSGLVESGVRSGEDHPGKRAPTHVEPLPLVAALGDRVRPGSNLALTKQLVGRVGLGGSCNSSRRGTRHGRCSPQPTVGR